MGDIIQINKFKPEASKDSKESDVAMFSVLWFTEHFGELFEDLELEVRYALIISTYRFMVDAESNGDVEITEEGCSIDNETSKELQNKIKSAVDYTTEKLN